MNHKKPAVDRWLTVRQTAAKGPISEYAIRLGIKEGWVPGMYVGNRFLVNYEMLLKVLEARSNENK